MEAHQRGAMALARMLDEHPQVEHVYYPGLETHPGHEVAARQMSAFGAIVSFELDTYDEAAAVVLRTRVFRRATSLGGVESVIEHRASVNPLAPPGLVRLSVGLEAPADLIADIAQALG